MTRAIAATVALLLLPLSAARADATTPCVVAPPLQLAAPVQAPGADQELRERLVAPPPPALGTGAKMMLGGVVVGALGLTTAAVVGISSTMDQLSCDLFNFHSNCASASRGSSTITGALVVAGAGALTTVVGALVHAGERPARAAN